MISDLIDVGLHVHNDNDVAGRWPDAVLPLDRLLIEYDSFRYHSDPPNAAADLVKQTVWESAGYLVVRVREQGLDQLRPWDILIETRSYRRLPPAARAVTASTIGAIARARAQPLAG